MAWWHCCPRHELSWLEKHPNDPDADGHRQYDYRCWFCCGPAERGIAHDFLNKPPSQLQRRW